MTRHSVAAIALAGLALAPSVRAAPAPDSMVVVESEGTAFQLLGARMELRSTESTWGDRRCTDVESRTAPVGGGDAMRRHDRLIVRLDRRVVWAVNLQDSTYMEFALGHDGVMKTLSPASPTGAWGTARRKEIGPGGPIRGWTTRRHEVRSSQAMPAGSDSAEFVHDLWVAREVAGLDRLQAFDRSYADSLRRSGPASSPLYDVARLVDGLPVRVVSRMRLPGAESLVGSEDPVTEHPEPPGPGDLAEDGSMILLRMEVVRVAVSPAVPSRFEVPPGWVRNTAAEADLREIEEMIRGAVGDKP